MFLVGIDFERDRLAVRVAQRGLERFGKALARVGATRSRSITTSTECLTFFARRGFASSSCTVPSMRTRVKPCARSSSSRSACSPLRPTITGARTIRRLSCGSAARLSTISETVCASSARLCTGQYGVPARAKSSLR